MVSDHPAIPFAAISYRRKRYILDFARFWKVAFVAQKLGLSGQGELESARQVIHAAIAGFEERAEDRKSVV